MRRLKVPVFRISESTQYVDWDVFRVMLKSVLRLGQPDFLAPGSTKASQVPAGATIAADPEDVKESRDEILDSMYFSLEAGFKHPNGAEGKQVTDAMNRIIRSMERVAREQNRRNLYQGERARRKAEVRGLNRKDADDA